MRRHRECHGPQETGVSAGAINSAYLGSRVGKYLPAKVMEKGLGVVFGSVGILVLALEFIV